MNLETRQAYSEVNSFLEIIGEDMKNKIPLKLRNFFKREMDKNYIPKFNANISIKEQNLKRKTIAIISGLNLQYWCNEERKQELLKIYSDNERKYQEELHIKYNPNNIFKNNKENKEESMFSSENTQLIVVEEVRWYKKIIIKLTNLFKKKSNI